MARGHLGLALLATLGALATPACRTSATATTGLRADDPADPPAPAAVPPSVPAASAAPASTPPAPAAQAGFAVVELFTSEGCSSCPPADRVFATLAESGRDPHARVFALAFHVDYWNSLGWTDRFSKESYSDRQRAYARAFGTGSIYTPQMIVNGVEPFNGSDRERATAAIARGLEVGAPTRVSLSVVTASSVTLSVRYDLENAPRDAVLNLALVEGALTSRVTAGENSGKVLHHENVVRAFVTVPVTDPSGVASLVLPTELDRAHASVVGYVQSRSGAGTGKWPIVAAERLSVPAK